MRSRRTLVVAFALVAALAGAAAACSNILGLEPPPIGDGGAPPVDATTGDAPGSDAPGPGVDGGTLDATGDAQVCTPLDGGGDGPTTYFPFNQTIIDDAGDHTWQFFEPDSVNPLSRNFQGGVYDGRYVYFAPSVSGTVTRYDTRASFVAGSSWTTFDTSTLNANAQGFGGAVYDGRYVYFVPSHAPSGYVGLLVRFDTQQAASFTTGGAAWSTFDMGTLPVPDGGLATTGFSSGVFDGNAVYFAPYFNGVHLSRVVQYSPDGGLPESGVAEAGTSDGGIDAGDSGLHDGGSDAGDSGLHDGGSDAGDAGDSGPHDSGAVEAGPPGFASASQFSTFDLSTRNASAAGYLGALFDGQYVYMVPYNGNAGLSGLVARYDTDASFVSGASWTIFDVTEVNASSAGFAGAAFDGRFVYLVPHVKTIATRYDTQGGSFTTKTPWSTFDVSTVVPTTDAGAPSFTGAGFDGRFIYYVPASTGAVLRYDTWSTFTEACAWSTHDISQDVAGAVAYYGAVYDGQYLYLVPKGTWVARFDTKTPGSMPALTGYNGSFY
jgi:hypothetical protein